MSCIAAAQYREGHSVRRTCKHVGPARRYGVNLDAAHFVVPTPLQASRQPGTSRADRSPFFGSMAYPGEGASRPCSAAPRLDAGPI